MPAHSCNIEAAVIILCLSFPMTFLSVTDEGLLLFNQAKLRQEAAEMSEEKPTSSNRYLP